MRTLARCFFVTPVGAVTMTVTAHALQEYFGVIRNDVLRASGLGIPHKTKNARPTYSFIMDEILHARHLKRKLAQRTSGKG